MPHVIVSAARSRSVEYDQCVEDSAVVLRLDASDSIVEASQGWLQSAASEGAPALTASAVRGRPFSDFSPDPDMAPVYQLVFKRVRTTGQLMRVPYRTDSPTERRYLEMEVAPLSDSFVECRTRTILVHERRPRCRPTRVSLFSPCAPGAER
jgi:hypothetical protein